MESSKSLKWRIWLTFIVAFLGMVYMTIKQGLVDMEQMFSLLRVAQEALANAIKHAEARRVVISLESGPEATRLRISDDGKGFDPGAPTQADGPHFGVLGMQERASRIGAELSIVGMPGAGCVVTLTLPCPVASEASPPSA